MSFLNFNCCQDTRKLKKKFKSTNLNQVTITKQKQNKTFSNKPPNSTHCFVEQKFCQTLRGCFVFVNNFNVGVIFCSSNGC